MATGDPSNPTRYLGGQVGVTNRELALDIYGGEVLAAFDLQVKMKDKVEMKMIPGGMKSARFPKTWKAVSEYHTPGQELLGTDIDTTEVVVTIDDILVSHVGVADLDDMLSHFEVRSKFSQAMGHELAKVYDKNTARQIILTARTPNDGPFPGGTVVTDPALTNDGVTNGEAWITAIRDANRALFGLDVPEFLRRWVAVNENVYEAIKYATDANGNYLLVNRDFGSIQNGGFAGPAGEFLNVDGVSVFRTRNLPTTDESADTSVYSKYRGNYSTTTGIMWCEMAVCTIQMMGIGFESERDTRRLEDFLVAKMLVGHGTLRPECAVEFRTAVPT